MRQYYSIHHTVMADYAINFYGLNCDHSVPINVKYKLFCLSGFCAEEPKNTNTGKSWFGAMSWFWNNHGLPFLPGNTFQDVTVRTFFFANYLMCRLAKLKLYNIYSLLYFLHFSSSSRFFNLNFNFLITAGLTEDLKLIFYPNYQDKNLCWDLVM